MLLKPFYGNLELQIRTHCRQHNYDLCTTDKKTTFVFPSFSLVNTICRTNKKILCLPQQLQHKYSNLGERNVGKTTIKKRSQKSLHILQFSGAYSVFQTSVLDHLFGHINIFG